MLKNVEKYIKKHAEPIVNNLTNFPKTSLFSNVVVIPAYRESSEFYRRYQETQFQQKNTLLILVINQPETCADSSKQIQLHHQVLRAGTVQWQQSNLTLIANHKHEKYTLVIDCFTEGLPSEQGVGLARKLGCDVATWLIFEKIVTCPWIFSTDADATLPVDYFTASQQTQGNSALIIFGFNHYSDEQTVHEATQAYELALRYYVSGLSYAGSTYAFFTIGSLLAINYLHYAAVRGFPKKSAGEDFYLINKLAKVGRVTTLNNLSITLQARTSSRVPFGTGPAVSHILNLNSEKLDYCYYHPQLFLFLKQTLQHLQCLWQHKENINQWLAQLPSIVVEALNDIQFFAFIDKQKNTSEQQFNKQVTIWFDAFKTLKFIHALRDKGYENIPLTQAIAEAPFRVKS